MKRLMPYWCGLLLCLLSLVACPGVKLPQETGEQEPGQEAVISPDQESVAEKQRDASEKGTDNVDAPAPDASEPTPEKTKDATKQDEVSADNGPDATPPDKDNTRYTVPAAGGKVCHQHICVDVPRSSKPEKEVVLVLKRDPNPLRGSIVPPMDVGPDNWKPVGKVTIEFDYSGATLPAGVTVSQLRVAFVQNNRWIYVPTQVDTTNKKIRGETTHFSRWGVVISNASCGRAADCHDAEVCNAGRCESKNCSTSADCPGGQTCTGNVCVPCTVAPEVCDGKDNDCDGQIDEAVTRPCYTGPPPTQNVGVCVAGQETCNAGQWGACLNEVKPSTDVCDGKDNNCDGRVDENCRTCRANADCQGGEQCTNGRCTLPCAAGQTLCRGGCSDLKVDDNNCGRCENACGSGKTCQSGSCQ